MNRLPSFLWILACGGLLALAGCMSMQAYAPPAPQLIPPEGADDVAGREILAQGRALYVRRCVSCHRLYPLSELHGKGFLVTLERMREKAELSDEDLRAILVYLEAAHMQQGG